MTAVIKFDAETDSSGTADTPVPAITYGPILAWKSLFASDFMRLARELARDLVQLKGVSAVIRRDPVPFWALWTLGEIPAVMHGTEEVCTCWIEGRFTGDPSPLLTGAWKRDANGRRIRFRKSGSKPFFEQVVILDAKTMRGIILARRNSYLGKLAAVLRVTPAYVPWTAPFDREDERKAAAKEAVLEARHPGRKAELDSFNAAMKDLIPFVNSGAVPDWTALAETYALPPDSLESLKGFYSQLVEKVRRLKK